MLTMKNCCTIVNVQKLMIILTEVVLIDMIRKIKVTEFRQGQNL